MTWLTGAVLGLHLISIHNVGGYETATPGVYLRLPSGVTLGHYRNSLGRPSTYAAYTAETADRRWAITVGAVTGYPAMPVAPMVVPSMRLSLGPADVRLAYIPKPPHYGGAHALHIALERDF